MVDPGGGARPERAAGKRIVAMPCDLTRSVLFCRSWNNVHHYLTSFLGFYYTHRLGPNRALDLTVIRDDFHPGFTSFLSFLQARKAEGDYCSKICFAGKHLQSVHICIGPLAPCHQHMTCGSRAPLDVQPRGCYTF